MSLFGSICPRCKKSCTSESFAAVSDGRMVCRTCAAEIKAASEGTRHCPLDGEAMEKQVCEFVLIDKCPACSGVWLDKDELEVIKQTVKDDATFSGFLVGWLTG